MVLSYLPYEKSYKKCVKKKKKKNGIDFSVIEHEKVESTFSEKIDISYLKNNGEKVDSTLSEK
jgi:hypothetical protein